MWKRFTKKLFEATNKSLLTRAAVLGTAFGVPAVALCEQPRKKIYGYAWKGDTTTSNDHCKSCGPGWATPLDAMKNSEREKLLYVPCTRGGQDTQSPDYLATVDCDPNSSTYSEVVSRVNIGLQEEVHHSGWNTCSSCHGNPNSKRDFLILPCLHSGNIHIIDVRDERKPKKFTTVPGAEIKKKAKMTYPHTSHCLADGKIMISHMGDENGHRKSGFLLLDEKFNIAGTWEAGKGKEKCGEFGYDFWYQPYHNIMVSTGWGSPTAFSRGFSLSDVMASKYSSEVYFWDWEKHVMNKKVTLPGTIMPLEVRFKHDPRSVHGYCGAALSSNVLHIYKHKNEWKIDSDYIQVDGVDLEEPIKDLDGNDVPSLPGLITDILISMDDKYLYFSNWLHGDIRQYDISDPLNPKLSGQIWLGGFLREGTPLKVKDPNFVPKKVPKIQGKELRGAPQMIQLSLDGKRLYVTNSLYSPFDAQFYPDIVTNGGQLYQIDIDDDGKMSLNPDFIVDFCDEPGGPSRPHEVRYPGGDCSSDIYTVENEKLATN